MFIVGYLAGGLLILFAIAEWLFGGISITPSYAPDQPHFNWSMVRGGCLIVLISRTGQLVARYIKSQEER